MALHPILPVIAGESLTSYLNRVARFHCEMGLFDFLEFIGVSRSKLITPRQETIDRLETLLGLSSRQLNTMCCQSLGNRQRMIAGEPVHVDFADMKKTCFCPCCLLEDASPASASRGVRVGRVSWQIEHIRACSVHGVELVRGKVGRFSDGLHLMAEVAPDDEKLEQLASEAREMGASALETYVLRRLKGAAGPTWLDDQPIDLAARTCEMLGTFLVNGPNANLNLMDEAAWHKAGHVGFEVAALGANGIREALQAHLAALAPSARCGRAQKVLGFLFKWIQFQRGAKDKGPIRDVLREFILDNIPYEAGSELFGEVVDRQRVHSSYTLSKKTGLNQSTLHRAAVLHGLLDANQDRILSHHVFDAEKGEEMAVRLSSAFSVKDLESFLNCSRIMAETLSRSGVIPRMHITEEKGRGTRKSIAPEGAQAFLDDLMAQANRVGKPSEGMMELMAAGLPARWPTIDIIHGILSGAFDRVEVVDPDLKLQGILVDPYEVRDVLSRRKGGGRVGKHEAAALIGMSVQDFQLLLTMRDSTGQPYITVQVEEKANRRPVQLFALEEIERFQQDHVALREICEVAGASPMGMKNKLDGIGAVQITACVPGVRVWYRRADVREVM